MPPVTIRLDSTKADILKGKTTGSPVSGVHQRTLSSLVLTQMSVPGCIVESMIFFAFHSSGVMSRRLPVLYAVTSCFAFSRPAEEVRSVLKTRC
jgi:hypothetical protein